jgi:hypothetical protein
MSWVTHLRTCSIMPVNLAGGGELIFFSPVATGAQLCHLEGGGSGLQSSTAIKAASAQSCGTRQRNPVMIVVVMLLMLLSAVQLLRRLYLETADKASVRVYCLFHSNTEIVTHRRVCMIIGTSQGTTPTGLVKRCVVCWLWAEQRKTYSFLCLHLCMSTGAPHVQSHGQLVPGCSTAPASPALIPPFDCRPR